MIHFPSWPGLSRPSTSFWLRCGKDVDARDKPTAVRHDSCLSCGFLRGGVSANVAAPLRGTGCMWSEVKSGLLLLRGWRSLEKLSDRAPVHQVCSQEPCEGERA